MPPTVPVLPPQQLSGPKEGPRAVGAARVLVSKRARGACDAGPPSEEILPCLSAIFVVYFRLSDPRKITTEILLPRNAFISALILLLEV